MSNFITNSGINSLKRRISKLIDKSNDLKFLAGFFYFSGHTYKLNNKKPKHFPPLAKIEVIPEER